MVYRRRDLKFNASKSKVMVLNGGEGLKYEVNIGGMRLERLVELKYLGCVLDESEGCRKVASRRKVTGAIRSLINARDLQLECARVLDETFLALVLMYGNEKML